MPSPKHHTKMKVKLRRRPSFISSPVVQRLSLVKIPPDDIEKAKVATYEELG